MGFMKTRPLQTTDDVIKALGGREAVAALVGRDKHSTLNWRSDGRGKFPSDTFLVMTKALEKKGLSAPPSLWGQIDPTRERASA